jgi:hypothetical protein
MSGSRSRRKGAQAERDLAKRFAEAMPGADCKRGIGQARRGSEVADCEVPRFFVESKHGKRPNPRAALAQCIEASEANGNGKTPIAVIRDDRKEPFVCMRLDDFLGFVSEWWGATRPVPTRGNAAAILAWAADNPAPGPFAAAPHMLVVDDETTLTDGFGGSWDKCGPACELELVRPGKVQCDRCDYRDAEASCAALDERDQGV